MIFLTRMDKQHIFINPDHIVSIEETPDTVITLFNDHRFIVTEPAQVIINKIVDFRARIIQRALPGTGKRHLLRTRKRLFRSDTLNRRELIIGEAPGRKSKTPLHVQDF